MTVTRSFDPMPTSQVAPLAPIQADDAEGHRILHALNALYEALRDSTAPGAASQVMMGHDHEYEGGWPITKGCVFSIDTGDEHLIELASGQGNTLGYAPTSPGLGERQGMQLVLFRYKVYGGDKWRLSFGGAWLELESFDEADHPRWAVAEARCPVLHGWQRFGVGAQRDGTSTGATCVLFGVHVYETANCISLVGADQRYLGSTTSYAYWGSDQRLDDILIQAGDWLDANTLLWLEECINALREHCDDRARPGSATGSQYIKGHDHNPSGQGGRPVPRGMVVSAADWRDRLFSQTCTTAGTYYYIDQDAGAVRRTDAGSTVAGTPTTTGQWRGPVSPGFTSAGSSPSAPYLTAWVYLYVASGSPTFDVRIRNLTAAAVSATTAAASAGWVFISQIPCTGDAWNEFVLEIAADTNATTVQLKAIMLAELGYHASTARTYVASSGTAILAAANEQR